MKKHNEKKSQIGINKRIFSWYKFAMETTFSDLEHSALKTA